MSQAHAPAAPALAPVATRSARRVWWREPMMWLVLGGPAIVVAASFVTLAIAITHPDPVLDTRASSVAADDVENGAHTGDHAGNLPAMQARNHAATGGKPEGVK
ncbi:hypothetical protein ACWA7J_04415 [Leptothrix sp. BB-4]